jgi:hypothetical protein|tara:strand:- start:1281 stop:1658 length:378 start_codon:yes stop_codon:yes gene_type:complete
MPKKKLSIIAKEQEVTFEEAMTIATEKLPKGSTTGKGKNTWVTEEGTKILEDSFMITEIIPKHYKGRVLNECPNPKYVSVVHQETKKRINVLVPRKWQGKLNKKEITYEAIEDINGASYRYVGKR